LGLGLLRGPIHSRTNDQLFELDVKGDDAGQLALDSLTSFTHFHPVRTKTPKLDLSSLRSYQVLRDRSAVPAVSSRTVTKSKKRLSYEEKKRMLSIGRRRGKSDGGIAAISTPAMTLSSDSSATGTYDVWTASLDMQVSVRVPLFLEQPHRTYLTSNLRPPNQWTKPTSPPLVNSHPCQPLIQERPTTLTSEHIRHSFTPLMKLKLSARKSRLSGGVLRRRCWRIGG